MLVIAMYWTQYAYIICFSLLYKLYYMFEFADSGGLGSFKGPRWLDMLYDVYYVFITHNNYIYKKIEY